MCLHNAGAVSPRSNVATGSSRHLTPHCTSSEVALWGSDLHVAGRQSTTADGRPIWTMFRLIITVGRNEIELPAWLVGSIRSSCYVTDSITHQELYGNARCLACEQAGSSGAGVRLATHKAKQRTKVGRYIVTFIPAFSRFTAGFSSSRPTRPLPTSSNLFRVRYRVDLPVEQGVAENWLTSVSAAGFPVRPNYSRPDLKPLLSGHESLRREAWPAPFQAPVASTRA